MAINYGPKVEAENLTYILSSDLTATYARNSVSIFKTSGANGWNRQAYSLTPFTAPCTLEFNKLAEVTNNGVSYAMISWNSDPLTNASYTSLDWAAYPYVTSAYWLYHNGSSISTGIAWDPAKKFYIVYDTDGYIRHWNGSTLLYSVNKGTGQTVYVDSSLYSPNSTYGGFSNIRAIKRAWNGTRYV